MTLPLLAAFGQTVFMLLLGSVATFLILLVLVQRGRGGGLAGALGGMGGSSAFGAKAGDVFTKITVVAAAFWIILCIAATKMTPDAENLVDTKVNTAASSDEVPSMGAPAGDKASAPAGDPAGDPTSNDDQSTADPSTPSDEAGAAEDTDATSKKTE